MIFKWRIYCCSQIHNSFNLLLCKQKSFEKAWYALVDNTSTIIIMRLKLYEKRGAQIYTTILICFFFQFLKFQNDCSTSFQMYNSCILIWLVGLDKGAHYLFIVWSTFDIFDGFAFPRAVFFSRFCFVNHKC